MDGVRLALESRLVRLWEGGPRTDPALALSLAPLAALYRVGVGVRGWSFDWGIRPVQSGGVPVLSVGNLAVGGTGKTPVTRWLVGNLKALQFRPGIVTRGYGEDEVLLHRRWNPDVPVIASPDRIRATREAARLGRDVVVLDDGFQHRRIHRDVDLVLLSPGHPYPIRVLPLGPYREPLRGLRRASHLLWVCKGARERALADQWIDRLRRVPDLPEGGRIDLVPAGWQDLEGGPASRPEGPVMILSSVARPASVRALVEEAGVEVVDEMVFPDHHPYRREEGVRISSRAQGRWVVTTEKDAVKLCRMKEFLPPVRVLALQVDGPPGGTGSDASRVDPRLAGLFRGLRSPGSM